MATEYQVHLQPADALRFHGETEQHAFARAQALSRDLNVLFARHDVRARAFIIDPLEPNRALEA